MRIPLISVLFFFVSVSLWWASNLKLSSFFDVLSIMLVVIFVSSGTLFLVRYSDTHWSEALWCLGIPAGLIGTTIGLTSMSDYSEPKTLNAAWPYLIIVTLYGAFFSTIGYFSLAGKADAKSVHKKPNLFHFIFLVLLPIGAVLVFLAFRSSTAFISVQALAIFSTLFALATLLKKKISLRDIAEIGLFGSILCLVLALIVWYSTEINSTNFALIGLLYGLLIYMLSYIASPLFSKTPENTLDVGRGNWHWIEITSFMLFMLFAPETIREGLVNESEYEIQNKERMVLVERIKILENKLEVLEKD